MSDHEKPQSLELVEALKRHGLSHDTPSQLSDAFRLGWNARADTILSDPRVKALVEALEQIQAHEEKDWDTRSGKAPPDVQGLCDIARAALAAMKGAANE